MRTLMKVTIPVQAGSAAIRDGRMPHLLEATLQRLKPEAAYFYPGRGQRTALVAFDLNDPSELPRSRSRSSRAAAPASSSSR